MKILLKDNNPLFESLINRSNTFPDLDRVLPRLLFQGWTIAYNADDPGIRDAQMFGFVKVQDSTVQIANRIFKMRLYNRYLSDYMEQDSAIFTAGSRQKERSIINGHLEVRRILEKFIETFDYLYGDRLLIEAVV